MAADIYDKLLLAKIQPANAKGVDAGPTVAANAIRVVDFSVGVIVDTISRKVKKATMGELPHLMNKKGIQIDCECDIHGSGVAGVPPELSPLLQMAALTESPNPGVDVRYAPTTKNRRVGTVHAYEDGLLWTLIDAVAEISTQYTIDNESKIKITISAGWNDPVAAPMPANAQFQSTQPIVGDTMDVVTENAGAIIVGSLALTAGNDIQQKRGTGQNEFTVRDRAPSVSITKDSVSDAADWLALTGAADVAINAQFGQTAGNKLAINIPRGRRESIKTGEKVDVFTRDVAYKLYETAGDDQFELIFS